ncbi:MAG: CoA transferase [Planctomycetaceae bacterium]|nr:CoA transferase [Planctomycetaceae bacterium]
MSLQPLLDFRVVSLAVNLPGPVAASQLCRLGALVTKIEPPAGDPLSVYAPQLYEQLREGQNVRTLDLKSLAGMDELRDLLTETDLLLTSSRPAALTRLGLTWEGLHQRYPRLVQVAIVGFAEPRQDEPGHDLTYQAMTGLLDPPHLPHALIADIGGAQQAVIAAMSLLLARERGQGAGYVEVSLAEAAVSFSDPVKAGMTSNGGILGGGLPGYGLYDTSDGWIAVAALERAFWERLQCELNVTAPTKTDLQKVFRSRTADEWEEWALERDLPIAAVRQP